MAEPAAGQGSYLNSSYFNQAGAETPLETAARTEASLEGSAAETRREEQEADVLVADIDAYVAQTDPASLPEAERALDAWQIPVSPLEGVPDNIVYAPNVEGEPLVAIFEAQNESEANIVRGLLEASGIPAVISSLSSPALGGIFQPGETRWGDLLVPASLAAAAQAAIAEATRSAAAAEDPDVTSFEA